MLRTTAVALVAAAAHTADAGANLRDLADQHNIFFGAATNFHYVRQITLGVRLSYDL